MSEVGSGAVLAVVVGAGEGGGVERELPAVQRWVAEQDRGAFRLRVVQKSGARSEGREPDGSREKNLLIQWVAMVGDAGFEPATPPV